MKNERQTQTPMQIYSHNNCCAITNVSNKVGVSDSNGTVKEDYKRQQDVLAPSEIVTQRTFWSKVKIGSPDECWPWQGGLMNPKPGQDYGQFHYHGKLTGAHRLSYLFKHGPIPEHTKVLHTCDTPRCVNPNHLRLGTQTENIADRHKKGRTWSKLTPEQVRDIRRFHAANPKSYRLKDLADQFGVAKTTIRDVLTGRRWGHLTCNPPERSLVQE